MEKKQIQFKTKGMNRDLSVSSFNPEFSFENMNLRLITNEGNTLMSWVTERGPKELPLSITGVETITPNTQNPKGSLFQHITISGKKDTAIRGIPIGTAVVNHKLVLFTTTTDSSKVLSESTTNPFGLQQFGGYPDYIYVLEFIDNSKTALKGRILYNGNLNFNPSYPLETLVSVESTYIEKVYWTDGLNQPRIINILADESKIAIWNSHREEIDTCFDFVPSVELKEHFTVEQNIHGGGSFTPGVIQYCFTYLNKHGQQTNIVETSPIFYLSHSDRGAGVDEEVGSSFLIKISNLDTSFDYVRLYSIQRTTENAEAYVKLLDDIPIAGDTYSNDLFSSTLIHITDSDNKYTLPRDAKGKILGVNVTGGTADVKVESLLNKDKDGNYVPVGGFEKDSDLKFIAYRKADKEHKNPVTLYTLQYLLDGLYYNSEEFSDITKDNTYHVGKYCAYFQCTQNMEELFDRLCEFNDSVDWRFAVDNKVIDGVDDNGIYRGYNDLYFVYSFVDKKWYISYSIPQEIESKNDVKTERVITYLDSGTTGSTVDQKEMLYIGGKEITAFTMADKDNTLFLGNLEQKNTLMNHLQDYFDNLRASGKEPKITFSNEGGGKALVLDHAYGMYGHSQELVYNQWRITSFKGGETYRFGFQLQKKTGEWMEPIFINDAENPLYPKSLMNNALFNSNIADLVNLVYAQATIDFTAKDSDDPDAKDFKSSIDDYTQFKRIRPVIVFPTMADRTVLCQGVLNPTVFNAQDRIDNSPYAQPSWFFRPYIWPYEKSSQESKIATVDVSKFIDIYCIRKPENPELGDGEDVDVCYVLIGNVSETALPHILQERSIGIDRDTAEESVDFRGAIKLSSNKYIFIKNTPWEQGVTYNGLSNIVIEEHPFYIYSGILCTNSSMLYYVMPDGGAGSRVFKFYARNDYYQITFHSIGKLGDYAVDDSDHGGTGLTFEHYNSLTSEDSLDVSNTANEFTKRFLPAHSEHNLNLARKIEIQGSLNTYDSVWNKIKEETSEGKEISSNTQFFVDQSIVTLNSPDLEFDTMVQVYPTEGLKLRVIGAIPITANASAHHIQTKTAMLEINHNLKQENTGTTFGKGELPDNVVYNNISIFAGNRLAADYLWNDTVVNSKPQASSGDGITTQDFAVDYLIHPWHRSGSLINDWRSNDKAASLLSTKKESTILYSLYTKYLSKPVSFSNISCRSILTENNEVTNYRLAHQMKDTPDINYYSNIDKVLVNGSKYLLYVRNKKDDGSDEFTTNQEIDNNSLAVFSTPVSMKYKSTTHEVIVLQSDGKGGIPILPYGYTVEDSSNNRTGYYNVSGNKGIPFWSNNSTEYSFSQSSVSLDDAFNGKRYSFLWLGELYRDNVSNRFGGTSDTALRANKWLVGGEAVDLIGTDGKWKNSVTLTWTHGDTYYQRYDCLKTYPFTNEDPNQLVEILSFMCETHKNIDGRYDKNRGQIDNTYIRPENFNKLNPVYSQKDNFFTYRKMDADKMESLKYPNQLWYSLTKQSGADVDKYTNVNLASVLELDGDKGSINAIRRFNNYLYAFQDSGISQLLYNDNVQISSQAGVPIEIANSGKLQGKRYLTDTIGCSNKWSIVTTPNGIYFMDNNDKSIYLFNGQLKNLSSEGGMNSWSKSNIPSSSAKWTPHKFENFTAYYDRKNQDVLFINKDLALAYSEKLGTFTSFYNYENVPYLVNIDDSVLLFKNISEYNIFSATPDYRIYKHNAGDYCKFFGVNKPYWMTLIGNPEPTKSKVFTNLEFTATVDTDGVYNDAKGEFTPYLPFDSLEAWNEYQHGITKLANRKGRLNMMHYTKDDISSLTRKYRIWRCDIPRDNASTELDNANIGLTKFSISRYKPRALSRIRNPWTYLKLEKKAESNDKVMNRTEIHNIILTYFS